MLDARAARKYEGEWGTTVNFTPSSNFEDEDKSAVLRAFLRIGWSVNEHKLDNGVALHVGRNPTWISSSWLARPICPHLRATRICRIRSFFPPHP